MNTVIQTNLRRLRTARGRTQEDIASRSGLSLSAYRKIECGKSDPRTTTLQALARALDTDIRDLVVPVRELREVRFRSLKRLRTRSQTLAQVSLWLDDFNELERLVGDRIDSGLEALRPAPGEAIIPQSAAAKARRAFGIDPRESIMDVCGLLESRGIKVGMLRVASGDFFGLSVAAGDGGPAIIVNTWERIPVERWIFTAIHELAHLILHLSDYDVVGTEETNEHEKQANAFASEFLMPDAVFRREWSEARGLALVDRVLKVKRMFRVSYRTVLYRLAETGMVSGNIWAQFQSAYRIGRGCVLQAKDEPDAMTGNEFRFGFPEPEASREPENLSRSDFRSDRLWTLVRDAIERDVISLGRGAEILRIGLPEMRDLASSWVA